MRAAFVLWPISQEGGLATRTVALVYAFREAGHEAEFIRLRYSDTDHRRGSSEPHVEKHGPNLRAQGRNLSITDAKLDDTLAALNTFDLIVFCHAAPHLSDKQRAVKNWQRVYTETRGRKIVYFSDVFARDYYPHIATVADTFEPVGVNYAAARYAADFLGLLSVRVPRHPFVFGAETGLLPKREPRVVWTSAWRSWKGIRAFVAAVPAIKAQVVLYGDGRELNNFRKQGWPEGWHGDVRGAQPPRIVETAYQLATASVDLTGQSTKYHGHYNRTTLEPMFFGAVSVARPESIAGSFVPLDCIWPIDRKADIAARINELHADDAAREETARRAYEWATDYFAPARVVASVLGEENDE